MSPLSTVNALNFLHCVSSSSTIFSVQFIRYSLSIFHTGIFTHLIIAILQSITLGYMCCTVCSSLRWQNVFIYLAVCNGQEGSRCVRSCVQDGNHQSCYGCNMYVTCNGGIKYDKRPCAATLVWDDNVKSCVFHSTTCKQC